MILPVLIVVFVITFCSSPVLALDKDVSQSPKGKAEKQVEHAGREVVTLFTAANRSEEVYTALKELAPDMKSDGKAQNWSRIEITIKQNNQDTKLFFNNDKSYYTGKQWEMERQGMYDYFSKFPTAPKKERALRLIKRFNFAVAAVLVPVRVKDDKRLKLILRLSDKVRAIMFVPGSMMDSFGRIIISMDGFSDPEARADL